MPRYFFHMQTDTRDSDEIGTELGGPIEARRQAIQTCGMMMKDSPEAFWGSRPWKVTVTDAGGTVLWDISTDGAASTACGKIAQKTANDF